MKRKENSGDLRLRGIALRSTDVLRACDYTEACLFTKDLRHRPWKGSKLIRGFLSPLL